MGDKERNFVGSRQWVGSLELSFCLDHLATVSQWFLEAEASEIKNCMFQITSKILSVTSGDEMGQKARELIHHFRTQGTPVMIGKGLQTSIRGTPCHA